MTAAAIDKKALDIEVLDVRGLVHYTDYLLICSGTSTTHVGSIADNIEDVMRAEHAKKPMGIEGRRTGLWILMDYADVVVHVFERDTRDFYELEKLWLDAPRVKPE